MYTPIPQWAEDDRPREKFLLKGKTSSYNPPRPFWYADNSTDPEAVAYKRSITVFNDKVAQMKGRFQSLDAVNLPADFGQLPARPPYPNTLHDLLQNPAKYAVIS